MLAHHRAAVAILSPYESDFNRLSAAVLQTEAELGEQRATEAVRLKALVSRTLTLSLSLSLTLTLTLYRLEAQLEDSLATEKQG